MTIRYEIVTTEVKPFTYQTPLIDINDNGEPEVHFSQSKSSHVYIKRITFLNLVGRDKSGNVISYEPMDYVNQFLMSHHIDDDKQESDQYSKGLVHFFSFLIALQELWDQELEENLYEDGVDSPRPTWDYMAPRKANRITYQYREALRQSVLNEPDPEYRLARTTATAYMNAVIKFYTFHLRHGFQFNNPPFDHEVVTIHYQANGTSMKPYMKKDVHTTDLRLNFPKSRRNDGGVIENFRRDLRPLSEAQWKEVEHILLHTRRVIKSVSGQKKMVKIAEEYCLFFLVCRYTGMRREEAASLHLGQIIQPVLNGAEFKKPILRIGIGGQYGSLTKTKGKGNKSRRTIIPSAIMSILYDYSRSDRYQDRLNKFQEQCKSKREAGDVAFFEGDDSVDEGKQYLFLSAKGIPFFLKLNELNSRWIEVRNTVSEKTNREFDLSIHNLRSTFAVNLFRLFLRKMTADKALTYVSELLGHEDIKTTTEYLKIAQSDPTGDEIYEDVLDWLGVFDDLDEAEGVTIHSLSSEVNHD
ncbi:site-specific integrase [Vibrio pelagius]|uniref:site-specific integrase n=1 Tax=Vibrio pelagius TaxID=28169 RepID=UPI0021C25B2B|nr:site-specific integrase [Vibrio pelagius]